MNQAGIKIINKGGGGMINWIDVDEQLPEEKIAVRVKLAITDMGGTRYKETTAFVSNKKFRRWNLDTDWVHVAYWTMNDEVEV